MTSLGPRRRLCSFVIAAVLVAFSSSLSIPVLKCFGYGRSARSKPTLALSALPSTKSVTTTETDTTSNTIGNITTTITKTTTVTETTTIAYADSIISPPASTGDTDFIPTSVKKVDGADEDTPLSEDSDISATMQMMAMMTKASNLESDGETDEKYDNLDEEIDALGGEAWFFDETDESGASSTAAKGTRPPPSPSPVPASWPTHTPTYRQASSLAPAPGQDTSERPTTRIRVEDLMSGGRFVDPNSGVLDATKGMREGDPARYMDPEDEIVEQGGDPWFLASEDE